MREIPGENQNEIIPEKMKLKEIFSQPTEEMTPSDEIIKRIVEASMPTGLAKQRIMKETLSETELQEEERLFLTRLNQNLEHNWTSLEAYEMKKRIKATFDFIERNYKSQGICEIDEILTSYQSRMQKNHAGIGSMSSYTLRNDLMERINELARSPNAKIAKEIAKFSNKTLKPMMNEQFQKILNEKIVLLLRELDFLGSLSQNQIKYNETMKKIGLEGLQLSDGAEAVSASGELYGVSLKDATIPQLEAIYTFYANRLEKEREKIGMGLFTIKKIIEQSRLQEEGEPERAVKTGTERLVIKSAMDSENLKAIWKRQQILLKIVERHQEEVIKILNEDVLGQNAKGEISVSKVYERIFKNYEERYPKILGDEKADLKADVELLVRTIGFERFAYYYSKEVMLEDLVMHASKQNWNWGIILEKDNRSSLKRYCFIGIDIPGLNMPLRLHFPIERIREIAKNYLKTEEFPLYIGNEDFSVNGRMIGTNLLLPLIPKQIEEVKKLAKKAKVNMIENVEIIKHIAATQLPNPIKKLLDDKTGRTQKYPDYISVVTGEIRRTPRKNIEIE